MREIASIAFDKNLISTPKINVAERNSGTHKIDLSGCEVTDIEKTKLQELFEEYNDCISWDDYDLGSYDDTLIDINTTTENPPAKFRNPRIPIKFQKEVEDHINKLLKAGRIVESNTPWVHPSVIVPKKNGSLRICLDLRSTNEVTIPDHFPLPRIDDLLAKVSGSKYFTSIDCASGYLQLKLSEKAQKKCGWITHVGVYEFVYLPFGLKNAGAYFSRTMSRILSGLQENCLFYLDDICIFTQTFEEHLKAIRTVFERFRTFKIKASGRKLTEIARSSIVFLGHEISGSGYKPANRNIEAIEKMPRPTNTKQVKCFLGMANFFRKFVNGFAKIASPLYEITREKVPFHWGSEQEASFRAIKGLLSKKPILGFPQDKEFILYTDGSQQAVGGALLQENNNSLCAIGYFSKTLSDSQKKWSATHIELFAIISSLRFFKHIIYGNHIVIRSDHKPLIYLLSHNKIHDNLSRWVIELQNFDCSIEYVKGKSNLVADCLSRSANPKVKFVDGTTEAEDIIDFPVALCFSPELLPVLTNKGTINVQDARTEQLRDEYCTLIRKILEEPAGVWESLERLEETDKQALLNEGEKCFVGKNGCLYRNLIDRKGLGKNLLIIPKKLQEAVFLAFHESPGTGGHFNGYKTLQKVRRKYFWQTMSQDILNWSRACIKCQQKTAALRNREPLAPIKSNFIFHKVFIDLAGPLPETDRGNRYLLATICGFSKYVTLTPIPNCQAITVARTLMNECVLKFGTMRELISDNASYLKGEIITELCNMLRIPRHLITPYHHEGNGSIERVFRTFNAMLRTYVNSSQTDWDLHASACAFAYNTSVHESLGETPFFMIFGRDPVFNIDLVIQRATDGHFPDESQVGEYKESLLRSLHAAWKSASEINDEARKKFEQTHAKNFKHLQPCDVAPGDTVLLRNLKPLPGLSRKLSMPWAGQFRVIKVERPHVVITSKTCPTATPQVVHLNQVKKLFEISGPVGSSQSLPEEEEERLQEAESTPLDLAGYGSSVTQPPATPKRESTKTEERPQRYNLRPRKSLTYNF